ncbi:MAG: hypothetical protein KBT27_09335 [Prevotellaceae bacterium]|nr:hypothetical protein [Candidatus Faecinaster equi]
MARQVLTPQIYAGLKRLNFKQMSDFLTDIYCSGMEDEKEKIMGDSDEAAVMSLSGFHDVLMDVEGMTPEFADKIVETIVTNYFNAS